MDKPTSNAAIGNNADSNQLRVDMRDGKGRHLLTVYIPAGNDYAKAKELQSDLQVTVVLSV